MISVCTKNLLSQNILLPQISTLTLYILDQLLLNKLMTVMASTSGAFRSSGVSSLPILPDVRHPNGFDNVRHSNHTAFATLAMSLGMAKSALATSWRSGSAQKRYDAQFGTQQESTRSEVITGSVPTSTSLYNLISKSSTAVSGGIKSLARRASQIELRRGTATIPDNHYTHNTHPEYHVPPLNQVRLQGYAPDTKTRVLTLEIAEEIRQLMPHRIQLHDTWELVYSLEQHGASLSTLYRSTEPPFDTLPGYVLVVQDRMHSIFGAYVNEGFRISKFKRYYGNGECFFWKFNEHKQDYEIPNLDDIGEDCSINSDVNEANESPNSNAPRFQAFPYTGLNDFIIFSTPQFLSMGGGNGHYGLWLDSNLENGVSDRSLTFGNDPLSNNGTKFEIIAVEVWRLG